ncbi:hypothetical protein GF325_15320 [Candidatus Bathyarchaeota archaeon]|nr:hypothetical protein [Candidatus Bathyarchaeota archaeon]
MMMMREKAMIILASIALLLGATGFFLGMLGFMNENDFTPQYWYVHDDSIDFHLDNGFNNGILENLTLEFNVTGSSNISLLVQFNTFASLTGASESLVLHLRFNDSYSIGSTELDSDFGSRSLSMQHLIQNVAPGEYNVTVEYWSMVSAIPGIDVSLEDSSMFIQSVPNLLE